MTHRKKKIETSNKNMCEKLEFITKDYFQLMLLVFMRINDYSKASPLLQAIFPNGVASL